MEISDNSMQDFDSNLHDGFDIATKTLIPKMGVVDLDKKEERKLIEDSLFHQLEEKGLTQQHYKSLVDDYMRLWDVKNGLFEDIEARGVSVQYNNGGGQSGWKKNDSVQEVNKISTQMLKVLSELGLRGANVKEPEENEDM